MPLTDAQRARYRRNIDVPGFGEEGQERLLASHAVVVGAGGLGSAALPYLVGAGVGRVTVVDGDVVEESNLQRQVLHREPGRNKADSAVTSLSTLNPDVRLTAVPEFLTADGADRLFPEADVILDCTDAIASKYLISDGAQRARRPLIWATAVAMQAQCSVFGVPDGNGDILWLRDLHPNEPAPDTIPQASSVGILGTTVSQMGTVQAGEALKLLAGFGTLLVGRVLLLDAANCRHHIIPLRKVDHP